MSFKKISFLFAAYSATYGGCGGDEAVHVCHDCPEGSTREFSRTRSFGFIKQGYLATLMANPTLVANWNTGIANGSIIMIPKASGSFDPGIPKELKGYGDLVKSAGPRTMKLASNDPNYVDNYDFWNEISGRTDLVPFYRTSSLVHIFDKPAYIIASDPAVDDLEEEIVWNVICEVISQNLPSKHSTANTLAAFSCASF